MKKTRFIALALVVALALSGAGYAFWTEELKINTTVTTGMLDFEFQNPAITPVSSGMNYDAPSYGSVNNPYNDDSTLNVKLYNMYPGSEATVYFEVKNAGTMNGKVEGFSLTEDHSPDYLDEIFVKSLKVSGVEQIAAPFNILDLSTKIGGLSVPINKGAAKGFHMTLYVQKCADEDRFEENLGRGIVGLDAITFDITAIGKQYNDDGSNCDPVVTPDPDPEIDGLRFVGHIEDEFGIVYTEAELKSMSESTLDNYFDGWFSIKGTAYYTYDVGNDVVAGQVDIPLNIGQSSASSQVFSDYYLDFTISWLWDAFPTNLTYEVSEALN